MSNSRKRFLRNNPDFLNQISNKMKDLYKKHPDILRRSSTTHKLTLKNHPEITKKIEERKKIFYSNHPDVRKRQSKRRLQTLKNNPDIMKKAMNKREQTYKSNPERRRKQVYSRLKTLKDNPEIMKNAAKKRLRTLEDNPEIMELSHNKAYETSKRNGFISKPEQEMVQLLREKFGEDNVISQYRDERYSNPGTNYRFACDCYIKSLDLFIEYNGSRFHPTEKDRYKLEEEVEKFKLRYPRKKLYKCQAYNLIKVIDSDKIKQQVARDNKLNYLIVTRLDELNKYYS